MQMHVVHEQSSPYTIYYIYKKNTCQCHAQKTNNNCIILNFYFLNLNVENSYELLSQEKLDALSLLIIIHLYINHNVPKSLTFE